MKYLLDTQVLLWWMDGNKKLGKNIKDIIENPINIKIVSVVSIWEISIKVGIKKLRLDVSLKNFIKKIKFQILNIDLDHVMGLEELPNIHKDPFDRMLIAQAKVGECTLITTDPKIKKYKVKIVG